MSLGDLLELLVIDTFASSSGIRVAFSLVWDCAIMKYIVFLTIVTCVLKSFLYLNGTNNSINFRIIRLNISEFEDGKSNFHCERLEASEKLQAQLIGKSIYSLKTIDIYFRFLKAENTLGGVSK